MTSAATVIVLAGPCPDGAARPASWAAECAQHLQECLHHVLRAGLQAIVVAAPDSAEIARAIVPASQVCLLEEDAQGAWLPHAIRLGLQASPQARGWVLLPAASLLPDVPDLLALAKGVTDSPVVRAEPNRGREPIMAFSSELYSELVGLRDERDFQRLAVRYPAAVVGNAVHG